MIFLLLLWMTKSCRSKLMGFVCRNFDEVLSSFAEPLLESASFSDSCSGLYDKENFKVSTVILSVFWSMV